MKRGAEAGGSVGDDSVVAAVGLVELVVVLVVVLVLVVVVESVVVEDEIFDASTPVVLSSLALVEIKSLSLATNSAPRRSVI